MIATANVDFEVTEKLDLSKVRCYFLTHIFLLVFLLLLYFSQISFSQFVLNSVMSYRPERFFLYQVGS